MSFWCIISVKTGREFKVEKLLKEKFIDEQFTPFVPMLEIINRTGGQDKKIIKPMFPSYVFVESDIPSDDFIKKTSSFIYSSNDIIELLRYAGKDNIITMPECERSFLLNLVNDDNCIKSSSGIIVGDRVYIKEGPLIGWESKIIKIDRHKRRAWIEIDIMGKVRSTIVALKIVEKIVI